MEMGLAKHVPECGDENTRSYACGPLQISESGQPTPDYKIVVNTETIFVEIKQIDKNDEFTKEGSSRIVGDHIRAKINDKHTRRQAKAALKYGFPFILLIYNNLDPMQGFGTERHDFIAAMYGELTIAFNPNDQSVTDSYHGRNQSLRQDKNTSFSAIGFLYQTNKSPNTRIYENTFAENKLNYSALPKCIKVERIKLA